MSTLSNMEAIDLARFSFSPTEGLAVAVMVGFLVFAVALELTWDQFYSGPPRGDA
ncbi:hypothetical protein [Marilutibacter alkalisoli]|uniref:hypothetical protein n=1 Tax=Marilutibacter alkalisoli TaxID=2591633 RepID=UPI00141E0EE7|nr:hypothetical protein [Lysobacter alkalisoli]